jgi:conjugative transfer signal peptidase TraF
MRLAGPLRFTRIPTVRELSGGLLALGAATSCASALACLVASHLLWNWTPSLPRGLYWVWPTTRPPHAGALIAFPVPAAVRDLVLERRYLPPGAWLVKPVVARAGDRVCTQDAILTVNGQAFGAIRTQDTAGRPLPHATACGPVPAGWLYVASHYAQSFDSRTFGPIRTRDLRGTVTPLWTY